MSEKTVFISYRRDATGKLFARTIKEALTHHGYDVFLDVDCLDAGKWATQILTQVPKRAHFLLLLTPGALDRCTQEDDWVRKEFLRAVAAGRNIVPIREESVDLGDLRTSCPEEMNKIFDYQIATIQHSSFEKDIETLIDRYIPPHKAPAEPVTSPVSASVTAVDISHIIKYAPAELIGREAETKLLNDAWDKTVRGEPQRPHVLTFVALGGEGKTSLVAKWVAKWAAELAHRNWPGCDAVFAWSFYSQGTRDQAAASSDVFLKEALTFFGDAALAESATGAYDKGKRLAQLVGERRALLIIDGLEPLQYAPTSPLPGELKDHGLAALLKGLAATSQGLCVVTTRYSIPDLRAYWQTTVQEKKLPRLPLKAGVALLRKLGVKGNQQEFETLVEDVKGHALTLNLLGSYLRDAHAGDIRKRDLVRFTEANDDEQGGHAFHVMDAYVTWFETGGKTPQENKKGRQALSLLRVIGLFDRPASADCLESLWKNPVITGLTEPLSGLSVAQRNIAFSRLEQAGLLTVNRAADGNLLSLDCHPLLREYFGGRLQKEQPKAWCSGHRRLYEHLRTTTKEGDQPTLEELQPLYQAVAHGCQAGLLQEACDKVYLDRILCGEKIYSANKLGAFGSDLGAVACFFETPWSHISPALTEASRAWLFNEAASRLRALGRLNDALEPLRAGLEMRVKKGNWKNAAIIAGNLSELELALGSGAGAIEAAELSVIYADRSGDWKQRITKRTTHADALHQMGHPAEAKARFHEAELMQSEHQPKYPLLYSFQGFRYCDLLLAEVEQEAWKAEGRSQITKFLTVCCAVEQRATQTLKLITDYGRDVLSPSLDHLTLGRAALYRAILEQANFLFSPSDLSNIDLAVSGLRRAGTMHHIPRGLLTSAWYAFTKATAYRQHDQQTQAADYEKRSKNDLEQAWEIAEHGPMPLFMADIHLYRARLFGRRKNEDGMKNYPWESPEKDLAEARRLIEKHGYWRRKEELEDAEAALL